MNPGWRLIAGLYPFGAGAVAVTLLFVSLILGWAGAPAIEPPQTVAGGLVLGMPATFAVARQIRRWMAEAEAAP